MSHGSDANKPAEPDESPHREARVFLEPGLEATEVRVPLLSDERQRVRELAERNAWAESEAHHIVFSRGLVALEHESEDAADLEGKRLLDMRTPEERERFLLARLSGIESRYSVMKFSAFTAIKANETLRMNVTGLKTEYQALFEQNKYLRGREDELRAHVAELERMVAEVAARPDTRVARPPSRWARSRELLRTLLERALRTIR